MTRPTEKRFDLVGPFDPIALEGKKPDVDQSTHDLVDRLDALSLDGAKPKKRLGLRRLFSSPRRDVALDDSPNANRQEPWTMQFALQFARKLGFKPNSPAKPTLVPPTSGIYPSPLLDTNVSPKVDAISAPLPAAVNTPTQPTVAVAPGRPRSVSLPSLPRPRKFDTAQCSGMTRAGRRCSRQVKLPATYSHLDPIPNLYCYQHGVSLASQPSTYIRKAGSSDKYVEYSHYIPKYLQKHTQLALKVEMEKATSAADKPGFVYAFEVKDEKETDVGIQLKVGRTTNLNKRLDDWDKQCAPKVHITRGWWPGLDDNGSLLKGNIKAGDPGPFCHRVERLVHIELADLSLHAPYLNPEWPNTMPEYSPQKRNAEEEKLCRGCNKVHVEIFTFPCPKDGKFKEKEWELIVKPVIEKWGRFVQEYYV